MDYIAKMKIGGTTVCKKVSREEAFKIIQPYPQVTVDCFDEHGHYGSFGCVFATQVQLNRQLEYRHEEKTTGRKTIGKEEDKLLLAGPSPG